jgi:outer membrane autotransporter protein
VCKVFFSLMLKSIFGAVGALAVSAAPVLADAVYFNPEYNAGWSGSDFGGAVLDAHVGYETDNGFFIQGGPSVLMPDGGEAETGFSAKTGIGASVSEAFDVYGEVSYAKYKDIDAGYGLKLGGKYKF